MQRTIAALCVAQACLAAGAAAQSVIRNIEGPLAGERFASSMLDAGDLNGDGYDDVLVGAPVYDSVRGAVYAISGHFIATGLQPEFVWSAVGLTQGDAFGSSLAAIGDVTGDGVSDFAFGAPDRDTAAGVDAGAVYVFNGATHAMWTVSGYYPGGRLGFSMSRYGDWDGDGKQDLVVGSPGGPTGRVIVISGAKLATGGSLSSPITVLSSVHGYGWSVASGFDVEGDGDNDILIGSPLAGASTQGLVELRRRSGQFLISNGPFPGVDAGDHMGLSVDARSDYDGDGFVDLVAGAPYSDSAGGPDNGRTVAISGADWIAGAANPVLFSWRPGTDHVYAGTCVRASADLNGDGVGDVLTGGPGYGPAGYGRVWIYSGATGEYIGSIVGSGQDAIGYALLGAFDDLDGDGYPEFAIGGPFSDANGNDSGILKCVRLFPVHASSYCQSKVNSLGCSPGMSAQQGYASASSPSPFLITGFDFLNQKNGLMFYGYDATSQPFQGGTLCVKQPIVRTAVQNSGGNVGGNSCTGTYSFDFNAQIQSGIDANLVVGRQAFCQFWSRDPLSASTTSLSDALRIFVNP